MRIAIPTNKGSDLAAHAGRAKGFLIYDIIDGSARQVEYRPNHFTNHARGMHAQNGECGGQGHHSHNSLLSALNDCQVIIAKGMGSRLVQDLQGYGIKVVFCRDKSAEKAVEAFAEGTLQDAGESSCKRGNRS